VRWSARTVFSLIWLKQFFFFCSFIAIVLLTFPYWVIFNMQIKRNNTGTWLFYLPFDRSRQLFKLHQYSLIFVLYNAIRIHWFWMSDVKLNCQTLSDGYSLSLRNQKHTLLLRSQFWKIASYRRIWVFFITNQLNFGGLLYRMLYRICSC